MKSEVAHELIGPNDLDRLLNEENVSLFVTANVPQRECIRHRSPNRDVDISEEIQHWGFAKKTIEERRAKKKEKRGQLNENGKG